MFCSSWRYCHLRNFSAEIKSQDAVYVLAYSVIMLNTDLHNPQVRVRELRMLSRVYKLIPHFLETHDY